MTEQAEPADDTKSRDRSPSTPFISLKKAVERTATLAKDFKKVPARLTVIAQSWGYAPKSSGLLQTASALTQYGLVTNSGSGEDRKIVLTELAWKILTDARPGERERALKEAALKPKLIKEYFNHWMDSRPVDDHCVSELTLDRGFTDAAARAFVKVYDETVTFANLLKDDTIASSLDSDAEDRGESPEGKEADVNPDIHRKPPEKTPPAPPAGRHRATLPTSDGVVSLEIPEGLSAANGEFIQNWVQLILRMHTINQ